MKWMLRFGSCACVAILFASCETPSRNPLAQPEKFAEVYSALQVLATQDSMTSTQVDSVLQQHGYSRAQFDNAVQHYNTHAEAWAKVVQHSVARLDSLARVKTRQDSLRLRTNETH